MSFVVPTEPTILRIFNEVKNDEWLQVTLLNGRNFRDTIGILGLVSEHEYLISIEFTSIHFFLSLLLKRNNNQSYEHV